jgi:two-component system, NtrC family, response regulator AtoC
MTELAQGDRAVVTQIPHARRDSGTIAAVNRGGPRSHDPASSVLELVVVADDAITVAALPAQGAVTLGRDDECEIRIESRSVSRRHAVLHIGPPLQIEDLGSANGTFVRDPRAPRDTANTHPLRKLSGQTIEIAIGERVNLGSIPIVIRRVAGDRHAPVAPDVVVRDAAMQALYEQVTRAARSTISVLVLGETGVGKEVLARAVHDRSPRARGPFLELNCAALPASLLEGELFGHEKGAFTGASHARPGLLESADGGTIFLDEVGELPLPVQVKLLRVLEDHKVLRIGGRTPRKLDVRFVAATNRDLEAEVTRGSFRQDLYFRLNGVAFVIPPMRERVAEIAPMAEQFLAVASQTLDRTSPFLLSSEALEYLERHAWPGNVRELRNVIERAAVLSLGDMIMPADLPGHITGATRGTAREPAAGARASGPIERSADRTAASAPTDRPPTAGQAAERQRIMETLEQCAGNQTRAAKQLGISLRTLVNRLDKYRIPRPRTDREG